MYFLTYVSRSSGHTSEAELQGILDKARQKNAEAGITGLLLLRSGLFVQLLEGNRPDVLSAFARIARDPRHRQIDVLFEFEEDGAQRCFPQWQMGFIEDAQASTGQTRLLRSLRNVASSGRPSRARLFELLRTFSTTVPTSAAEVLKNMGDTVHGADVKTSSATSAR
ncbi:MAG: BLUF domain-containing protein [Vicinamibacterales bacterium]